MPTYEYRCPKCENEQEDFHWISQNPEIKCEECGEVMVRQLSACGVVFKGSGFYATDYKNPEQSNQAVRKTVKSLAQGDQKVAEDIVGDPTKLQAEHKKQQKVKEKKGKNLPIKRKGL